MDLLPTEEQQQIVDTARNFLSKEFPLADALLMDEGQTRITGENLQQVAAMGWMGIGLPEEHGGVGYGLAEEVLLFVELGRNLMPPSLIGAAIGARVAALCGNDSLIAGILEGSSRVALATVRPGKACTIGEQVSGEFLAFEAADADMLLLAESGCATLVPLSALERIDSARCIDPTLDLTVFSASGSNALACVRASTEAIFARGAVLVSAMLLGIAEATLERSVEYAGEREQYGKPIGSFQAIKHYCAEMAIRCESVRAMLYHTSITLGEQHSASAFDTHTLKALAQEAAELNANTAVQIHGGMGYTQEMDIHLFVKRAQVLANLFGSERLHLRELLRQDRPD